MHGRIGTVQIHNGQLRDAVATLQEGIRTSASFATTRDTSFLLAMADVYLASSEARRNLSDFQEPPTKDAIECLGLYRQVASVRQEDPDLRHSLAGAYASVGMSESQVGRLDEALVHFRDGVAEMEKLVAAEPRNVSWSRDLMLAYGHVADVLGNPAMQNLGDREAALHVYQQAADIGKPGIADAADQRAAADFGIVLNRVETAMDDTDLAAKIAVQRESLQVLERAAAMSPGNVSLQTYRSSVDEHLGDSSTAIGGTRVGAQGLPGICGDIRAEHAVGKHRIDNPVHPLDRQARVERRGQVAAGRGAGLCSTCAPRGGESACRRDAYSCRASGVIGHGPHLRCPPPKPAAFSWRQGAGAIVARQEHGRVAGESVRSRLRRTPSA